MVRFIAEVCSNHNQDLARALKLVETAKAVGCDAVKFQLFRVDKMFAPELLADPAYKFVLERRGWELPIAWLKPIRDKCDEVGIKFGCTPFYLEAVEELEPYVEFFKIASYELPWKDLIKAVAKTGREAILSTGMATVKEIKTAVVHWQMQAVELPPLTLLHCVSEYPAPVERCNLKFIARLRAELNSVDAVGYSDHSVNGGVILRAVHRFGAEVVEFHLDLEDGGGVEFGLGHCWKPCQIGPVIRMAREGEWADGVGEVDVSRFRERDFRRDGDGLRPMGYMRTLMGGNT